MKFLKESKFQFLSTGLSILAMFFLVACGSGTDDAHTHDGDDATHMHDGEDATHMHEDGEHADHMHDDAAMSQSNMEMMDYSGQASDLFKEQLNALVDNYQVLKNALVQTDYQQAQTAAAQTLETLNKVDMSQVEGTAHNFWMEQMKPMQTHLEAMTAAADIEEIRTHFAGLTEPMKQSIAAYGTGQTMYVQYCPMAFDNTGASWISDDQAIRNPYFGDKMLKCGSVKETLAAN